MSRASAVGQVIYSPKTGTFMPAIESDKGDLYQEYNGDALNPVDIAPDFTTLLPVLSFVIISSRVAEGLVVPNSVKWYFNDTELTFNTSRLSTNTFSGETNHFEYIPYAAGTQNYYALRIRKNLVKAASASTCTIKAVATVTIGNTSDQIQCTYTIPVTYGVGNSKRVTIMAGDNNYFTILEKGGSCKLKAVARVGADEITSGLTYKWYELVDGAWSLLSGQTAQTLTHHPQSRTGGRDHPRRGRHGDLHAHLGEAGADHEVQGHAVLLRLHGLGGQPAQHGLHHRQGVRHVHLRHVRPGGRQRKLHHQHGGVSTWHWRARQEK